MSDAGDKLARTRLAIIAHVQQRQRRSTSSAARHIDPDTGIEETWKEEDEPSPSASSRVRGWAARLRRAGSTWWRHHPAHAGLELARPVLESYARRAPVTYLAVAAVAGAALVFTRPWRLISASGLLLGLLKSSQLSALVLSAMSAADYGSGSGGEPPA